MGSYQSGQMGLTVTQLAFAFGGSNPSLPTNKKDSKKSPFLFLSIKKVLPYH